MHINIFMYTYMYIYMVMDLKQIYLEHISLIDHKGLY